VNTWTITSQELKDKFWRMYPFIDLQYSQKLPNASVFIGNEWLMPIPDTAPKLVRQDGSHVVRNIKYIKFEKTRVVFSLPGSSKEELFIWVQKGVR
jgi:hypothetical protein